MTAEPVVMCSHIRQPVVMNDTLCRRSGVHHAKSSLDGGSRSQPFDAILLRVCRQDAFPPPHLFSRDRSSSVCRRGFPTGPNAGVGSRWENGFRYVPAMTGTGRRPYNASLFLPPPSMVRFPA